MARKNKKKNRESFPAAKSSVPTVDSKKQPEQAKKPNPGQPIRETVESLVIAFVLAFLFRTFQAEAFVIPTGSMAPTLMGAHRDVDCPECGQRFKVNASSESADNLPTYKVRGLFDSHANRAFAMGDSVRGKAYKRIQKSPTPVIRRQVDTVSGVCTSCRNVMPLMADVPESTVLPGMSPEDTSTYSGDRILVNKYLYSFTEPKRWDVIVFKYPGDATRNYIKRLVGLPSEELLIAGGDVYTRDAGSDGDYAIARKPPRKMLAVRQLVHDTDREAAGLREAGWPLRWQPEASSPGWETTEEVDGSLVAQSFSASAGPDQTAWLRYRHTPAPYEAWEAVRRKDSLPAPKPQCVTDFNAYNTEKLRQDLTLNMPGAILGPDPTREGIHWVGDLMVEADVMSKNGTGELLLDLVEAGRHYRCSINLETGNASLSAYEHESEEAIEGFTTEGQTALRGTGRHIVRFANFDDELTLWVDGKVVSFDAPTTTPPMDMLAPPKTSKTDAGDLAPVGVGIRGGEALVSRLQVFRDLYYIAVSAERPNTDRGFNSLVDYPQDGRLISSFEGQQEPVWEVSRTPAMWPVLADRDTVTFETGEDQFFVLGDNSAASKDCRLWNVEEDDGSKPGGPYLERSLLIGKAVCVYWPHSWGHVPGTPIPFPLFPNFTDMRLVR